jgi:hypothetical protein
MRESVLGTFSSRFYEMDARHFDPLLPAIVPLPAEFWSAG